MPAQKKTTIKPRRTPARPTEKKGATTPSAPKSSTKPTRIPTNAQREEARDQSAAHLQPTISSRPTMPMPVAPQHLPSKRSITPLIKTTYNTSRIRRFGVVLAALVVCGAITNAWLYRDRILALVALTQPQDMTSEPTRLTIVATPTPDVEKLAEINQRWQESSASAQPVNYLATGSAELATQLSQQTTAHLRNQLNTYIESLAADGVNVANLKAYQQKIDAFTATGDTESAHRWLVEAVIHAKELELVNVYHHR